MIDTDHFKSKEFKCPCCGLEKMSQLAVNQLEYARSLANVPFIILSGTRCENHNKKVGGVGTSSHVPWYGESYAVDIRVKESMKRFLILSSLVRAGFNRIGIGKNYIHADCDASKAGNVIWLYDDPKPEAPKEGG